jgi:predicted permease
LKETAMRFTKLFRAESRKSDLDDEIAAHLAMAAADKREQGADPATAQQQARREFGNAALVKDVTRESWGWLWLERILQDLRYALRQMRKSPGFALAVIGTLALGIAAATAMFTVVDQTLLRPLPYPHASQLVEIQSPDTSGNFSSPTYLDIAAWRKQAKSFEHIAFTGGDLNGRTFMGTTQSSTQVWWTLASPNLFRTLGVSPQLGPGLPDTPAIFAKSASDNTVVLSDAAWRSIFHADRNIVGHTVQINGRPYTVTGVMPRGFGYPYASSDTPQIWSPLSLSAKDQVRNDDTPEYDVIARLRPGVKPATALAELSTLQQHLAKSYPNAHLKEKYSRVRLLSYTGTFVQKSTSHALYALLAAALLLWLIACVNATNLLLARALARQREMAMRGALGASRWRLTQQLIVESCLLSGIAALLGAAMAVAMIRFFHHALKSHLPFFVPASVNLPVLAGLAALTLLSALLAAAWPAWIAAHSPIEPSLRQGGQQSGTSRSHHRLRGGLVIAEIAMSLTLLAACGLMLRTIYALRHVSLGFRADHILVANLDIPTYRFSKINATTDLYQPLLGRVRHMPGIDAAGLMTEVPLGHTFRMQLSMYGDKNGEHPSVTSFFKAVSPELQQVFGFKMYAGRYFSPQDTAASEPVLVVNRAFAHAYAPHQQDLSKVVGMKVLKLNGKKGKQATIIGILDDFRQGNVDHTASPEVEVSLSQLTPDSGFYTVLEGIAMDLAVRTHRSTAQVIPELRSALRQADPALANSNITTMDQIVEDSYGSQALAAHLLEIFAASALLLCVAGLYGLLAYIVSQRTREMGVRFALGAQRTDVVWLIMRQAGVLVIAGVAIGLALAFASTRFIRSYLYGVSARDAWTLAAVAIVLIVSGAVAAYLPARRAAQVNPVEALRAE